MSERGHEATTRERMQAIVRTVEEERAARDAASAVRDRDHLERLYVPRALELILLDVETAARKGERLAVFGYGGLSDEGEFFWRGFYDRLDIRHRDDVPDRAETVWLMDRLAESLRSPDHQFGAEVRDKSLTGLRLYVSWG